MGRMISSGIDDPHEPKRHIWSYHPSQYWRPLLRSAHAARAAFRLIAAFLITAPILFIANGTSSIGPLDVRSALEAREHLDPYLRRVMDEGEVEMRVLVRFTGWPIVEDIRSAEGLGMDHICSMQVLPAALFKGTSEQISKLSRMPWVEWIEYDGELELLMEQSLLTINATVT
jgi:hypothetical protein